MTLTDEPLQMDAPCDFEHTAATKWRNSVIRALRDDTSVVEIDLSRTRNIDSSGLSALLGINEKLANQRGQLRLLNPSPVVTQMLELTSLHRVFSITHGPRPRRQTEMRPILVVEDEAIIRSVAELSLKPLGHPVVFAENGRQAINMARRDPPVVIVLDYIMPLMDGTETLQRLKNDPATRDIPVIVMSASERIARGAYDDFNGAACFLAKPFSPTALRSEVHRLIQHLPDTIAS